MAAQADLGLCCPHMPEDRFLHATAHIINKLSAKFAVYNFLHQKMYKQKYGPQHNKKALMVYVDRKVFSV